MDTGNDVDKYRIGKNKDRINFFWTCSFPDVSLLGKYFNLSLEPYQYPSIKNPTNRSPE